MSAPSWLGKLVHKISGLVSDKKNNANNMENASQDRGMLVFENTSEVIAAERTLRQAVFDVEVKGPPPDLQTGCDMVVLFPLLQLASVESTLKRNGIIAQRVIPLADKLLDPVSLIHTKDLGDWIMTRAANMKITVDKRSGIIVNISGGGCPDVPWLAMQYCGQRLCDSPAPISIGHTLCCYSLQKAWEELRVHLQCG